VENRPLWFKSSLWSREKPNNAKVAKDPKNTVAHKKMEMPCGARSLLLW